MKQLKIYSQILVFTILGIAAIQQISAQTADSLLLYTPYTKISVAPGKSVSYSIDVLNKGSHVQNESVFVSNIPRSWNHTLMAGGYSVNKLAILPGEKKTLSLKIDVRYQVRKGNYTFYVKAGNKAEMQLVINVSTAGSSESEFSCDQRNMEGTSKSSFNFKAVLRNRTAQKQQYALMAKAPRGWVVAIKPSYKQATSTEVDANGTKDISFDIKPPNTVKAGTYKIPIKAVAGSTLAKLEFEVVITGTFDLTLNTPSGLLSGRLTAGDEKKVELLVTNSGSATLEDIKLSSNKPKKWDVTFDKDKIDQLLPGKTEKVYATIKADKKAIPGDYITKINAKTAEVNSSVSFRVSVKTPVITGWIGILIIVLAVAGVFY
ncbi:MAG: NEW3 domain-containing protein, partial [Draconibacterium sp.]|nr:NEW3 domain-containing protein [Draconibacterium sp.]